MSELRFRRFDAAAARNQRDTVALIHRDAYAERIASGDKFNNADAFMTRFDAYAARDGLDLVIAYDDSEPVGQTWGWPIRSTSPTWDGLTAPETLKPGFTDEDGTRTFALSEIMVRQHWAGRGVAHALHDELLRNRPEQRAMLLVNPDNDRAYRAYTSWGWSKVAQLRPNWPNAPLFNVMILILRPNPTS